MLTDIERQAKYEQCIELTKTNSEKALGVALELLDDDPDDATAMFQASKILLDQSRRGLAYNLMARAVKTRPDIPEMWLQYGQAHGETPEQWGKSEWCFKKALKVAAKLNKPLHTAITCLATLAYLKGDYDKAMELCDEATAIEADAPNATSTKAFCHLAKHEWQEGWEAYEVMLGKRRESYAYGDEPEWDGAPGKRLIISGEQGIGDEIMYASCFNDVLNDSPHVVIECMPRLEKLFKRSFPDAAAVYGSRWDKNVVWQEDHAPDAHVAMATLPKFLRNRDEDFPGTPYLTPDPDMVDAVKGLLSPLGNKPNIGIAWTGGSDRTRGHLRTRTLEELTPVLRTPGVNWISLEYYNRDEEIGKYHSDRSIPIHVYEWLTARGLDYDLTAALISQLDLVISVPTTGVQMAGALGVETWCIVPRYTGWMFAKDTYPWAHSVTPIHNPPIRDLEERLQRWMQERNAQAA